MKKLIMLLLLLIAATAQAETVKAYLSIDDLNDAEEAGFIALAGSFFVEYSRINIRNNRRFYIGLIRDDAQVNAFLSAMKTKNPVVLGMFHHNGVQVGKTITVIDEVTTITGTATYPFQKEKYIALMPDEHTYNDNGQVLTTTRPTAVRALKNFGGWGECIFEETE